MRPRNKILSPRDDTASFKKKLFREFLGVLFFGAAVLAFVSLTSFSPSDPSFNRGLASAGKAKVHNYGGIIGAYISESLVQFFGGASFLPAAFFLVLSWGFIRLRSLGYFLRSGLIWTLTTFSICALFALYFQEDPFFGKGAKPGGMAGLFLSSLFVGYLNKAGSYILVATLLYLSLMMTTRLSLNVTVEVIKTVMLALLRIAGHFFLAAKEMFFDIFSTGSERLAAIIEEKREQWKHRTEERARLSEEGGSLDEEDDLPSKLIDKLEESASGPRIIRDTDDSQDKQSRREGKKEMQEPFPFYEKTGRYKVPPVSLLEQPPPKEEFQKKNEEELIINAKILEKKLEAFGVQGKVTQVLPGPVITLYEYEPGTGVKVSKIMNLSDDLALSMRAATVRILAPVPGKAVVGIEIPNRHRETVYLREVLSSSLYQNTKSKLTIAIGHDTAGQPVVADLAQIPHLLIAGSTGSGKSVGVNGMICSILLKAKPDEVKFIMIDPKMLELSTYEGIPHLISPVVTDPKKATAALRWAVEEMERRYKAMSEYSVRNIQGYNKLVKEKKKTKERGSEEEDEGEELLFRSLGEKDDELKDRFAEPSDEELPDEKTLEPPSEAMPYIVIVIDELADLMMTAPKEVEISIARLAQMARAAGIHLIVATQRPSVDVLTGLIKANFPARVAYKVASRVDSRTILDHIGAEKLLGKGDLLFNPPGASKLERIHGCWVSDLEVKRVVEFLKRQQKPVYIKDILKARVEEKDAGGEDGDDYDPVYDEAVALVTSTRMASISMVQRKLRIGYNRAARLIEKMEKEGIVGPSDGVKQREVYAREI
ncbi:MAG: DNA translocase FtsK 4TM domain-containing protein [Nitrospinae bacterium]|nr:DNA translocase FtsK 4TM domain-containing protein [Nitrospinota bacterium]